MFLAHTVVGNREALSTRPPVPDGAAAAESTTVDRNWVQSLCVFQLVTADLFVLSLLLFAPGATDLVPAKREVALATAMFFALWGLAWLIQLLVLRRRLRDYILLSQWLFWFVCAGLLFWGAGSMKGPNHALAAGG
ncbi:hypothetical protein J8C06_13745 [Chloracidobacterium validum]|uniref:Uncharacterized protein n=1 Tax=Chloracidobacterium validum TaxID=2821543 RepID=A0ABX8BG98_9BACT|nr:hypothetical protein [Chloracidobacterium validum]QUW04110.1 hypothetical protein J8C06_13745 [Chloracidobacterium validum]